MEQFIAGFLPKSCAVIADVSDGNDLQLKEEALADILNNPKIQGKPLVVVSIAGAFRKGKSFMLNLLMRYLQKKGQIYANWLGLEAIGNGFFWRGGTEAVTTGITMWKEPFFVKDDRGREVAILLMDTQGLFDHDAKMDFHSRIFAFSTLISSVQVYNLSQQIQGYDLDYLQLFVQYAKFVRGRNGASRFPFQKLVFLVRDWTDPRSYDYGHDGTRGERSYLSKILQKEGNREFGDKLKESFECVDCFLMPYPGMKVTTTSKTFEFRGDLEDIEAEFKKYTKTFAISLFDSINLVPKKINGEEVTARELLDYVVSSSNQFKKGSAPAIGSMIEATAVTLCIRISESLVKNYDEEMEKMLKQAREYLSDESLQEKHDIEEKKLLSQFRNQAQFGDDSVVKKYSDALIAELESRYVLFKRSNEMKKKNLEADMYREIVHSLDGFSTMYSKFGDLITTGEADSEKENIVKKFSDEFRDYPNQEHYTKMLRENLEGMRDKRQGIKRKERAHQISGKTKLDQELRSRVAKVTSKCLDEEKLEEKCKKYKEEVLDKHCKNMPVGEATQLRDKVGQVLDEEIKSILYRNSLKEGAVRLLFQNENDELLTDYLKIMKEGMRSSYVKPHVMEEVHDKTKEMLEKKMRSNKKIRGQYDGKKLWEEFLKKLNENLDEEFQKMLKTNEKSQLIFPRTIFTVSAFFSTAGMVLLVVIGVPIAIALGIPVAIFGGIYKGFTELGKLVKCKLGEERKNN